jgi:Fe2+ or Zn2+ uptake regulation protein
MTSLRFLGYAQVADDVAKTQGFVRPSHTIDIFGDCESCSKKS